MNMSRQQVVLFLSMGVVIIALAFYALTKSDNALNIDTRASSVAGDAVLPTVEPTDIPDLMTEKVFESTSTEITVYIAGCVNEPGVYTLKSGSRLIDAVEFAGGLSEEADHNAINLAMRIADEGMYVVPKVGEAAVVSKEITSLAESSTMIGGKTNINTAVMQELEALPGIGPSKAEAIIEYRQSNGCFSCVEDIMNVSGIGPKTFEGLCDMICVN